MAASGIELESKRVCELLVYLNTCLGRFSQGWIIEASMNYYGNVNRLDEATALLCNNCRLLSKEEAEKFIYDGRNKDARRLADWWERHQEWDARRVAEEDGSRKKALLRERALKKLTVEEMKVLGLVW
jgi:hypothetical protein